MPQGVEHRKYSASCSPAQTLDAAGVEHDGDGHATTRGMAAQTLDAWALSTN